MRVSSHLHPSRDDSEQSLQRHRADLWRQLQLSRSATDAAANFSGYSSVASATTPDTQPPTAPSGLTATAVSGTQVNLSWTASTDNVGVTGYLVERSQGSGSTTFTQVGTPTGTSFNNTGLSPGIVYNYRVRATDAVGNLGGYSSVVTATTPDPGTTVPGALAATAASASQISLSWTASTTMSV